MLVLTVAENDMLEHDVEYCTFRELTALVMSWNAGAATPTHLRHDERDSRFFQDVFRATSPPDLLVFGFQELVDLEDKRLTASSWLPSLVNVLDLTLSRDSFQREQKERSVRTRAYEPPV